VAGHSSISAGVLASYAADAARDVPGVRNLVRNALHRHEGVTVGEDNGRLGVELHLSLEWGANAATVGAKVQTEVADVLARMADVRPATVDVVIDEFSAPTD